LWRIVCLALGVLGGHLALLGWLQTAPDLHASSATPPLRFKLASDALPVRPSVTPSLPPARPQRQNSGKVQTSTRMAAPIRSESETTGATEVTRSAPSPLTTPGMELSAETSVPGTLPVTHAGSAIPDMATPTSAATSAATVLPSSHADYLNNPAPSYPAISHRLGEQGKVIVRVLIGKDGLAQQGDIHQSSGYARLDQAALRAVMGWRYVPGRRDGVAQDMWFNVPINFALN